MRGLGRDAAPLAEIVVSLRLTVEEDGLEAEVTPPEGVTGVFVWGGVEREMTGGRQALRF